MRTRKLLRVLALLVKLLSLLDARDTVAVAGLAMMAWGLSMVSLPAALVIPGGLLFLMAAWPVFSARR